jgi:protein-S-isoprenylcysteine O-methyltransferase Ste14
MRAAELVFGVGWTAFWLYWLVAAFSRKRGHVAWGHEVRIRIVIVAAAVIAARLGAFRGGHAVATDPPRAGIGLALFALGLAFAIWARVQLGRNWGTPMTTKDDPELVTSGPYRYVRHPIYSGIITAALGTAVGLSWSWLIAFGLAGAYFVYAATVEEKNLAKEFPAAYPAYRRATKMLIPFVL